ncbi:MAG TPA: cupin domain-containing protein [Verrucomicrobiae bacterium]|nr:cupin domain-containing protein [Verrucomicrobiae bacterium]
MVIVNAERIDWLERKSPNGKFARAGKNISEALGRDRRSLDLLERHPFDVEITKVPPGKASCPYHSHSAQWELYHVISGTGRVRHAGGTSAIEAGDAFVFKPNEPHQIVNDGSEDLVYYVVADNPIGESCHYPDSGKWAVKAPEYRLIRSDPLDYYDGEE